MSNLVIEINQADFETQVLKSTTPVLVDFWAPWCGPCRMLAPIVDNLANFYQGKVKFVKVNVDNNPDLAIKFDVQSIPTVLIFNNGNMVGNALIGVKPISEYQSILDSQVNSATAGAQATQAPAHPQNIVDVKGENDFTSRLKEENKLIIVDFWAAWCGPCKVLKPSLEKLANDNPDKITLLKINVDEPENQMLTMNYGVSGIPQVNFFRSGVQVHQFVGAMPYEHVKNVVEDLLK